MRVKRRSSINWDKNILTTRKDMRKRRKEGGQHNVILRFWWSQTAVKRANLPRDPIQGNKKTSNLRKGLKRRLLRDKKLQSKNIWKGELSTKVLCPYLLLLNVQKLLRWEFYLSNNCLNLLIKRDPINSHLWRMKQTLQSDSLKRKRRCQLLIWLKQGFPWRMINKNIFIQYNQEWKFWILESIKY